MKGLLTKSFRIDKSWIGMPSLRATFIVTFVQNNQILSASQCEINE